jgi:type I restriction enzyme S subunit
MKNRTFKQTEAGSIPQEWEASPFYSTVSVVGGQVDPKKSPYNEMILVAPDHIERNTGRLLAKVTAKDQGAISGKYQFRSGDVIYSKIRPNLCKATLADFDGLCSADMYALRPSGDVQSRYILNVLLAHKFTSFATSVSMRSGMPKINREELAQYYFPLPTLPEQRAIAEALSDVDDLINSLDKLIAKKRAIKQATMQQLLTGKTRLPGFSGEWNRRTLGSILKEFKNGYAFSASGYVAQGIPIITMAQIGLDGTFQYSPEKMNYWRADHSAMLKDFVISNRALIVAMTDVTPEKNLIGRMAEIDVQENFLLNQRVGWLKLIESEADTSFIRAYSCTDQWRRYCIGSASLGVQANIGTKELRTGEIYLPSLDEQTAISRVIDSMNSDILKLVEKIQKIKVVKQGMMQELLTGKTRLI